MILSSNGIQIYLDRANEFIENENFENALKCFNKVLELENDNVTALCSKGHILYALDNVEGAIEVYKEALKLNVDCWESDGLEDRYLELIFSCLSEILFANYDELEQNFKNLADDYNLFYGIFEDVKYDFASRYCIAMSVGMKAGLKSKKFDFYNSKTDFLKSKKMLEDLKNEMAESKDLSEYTLLVEYSLNFVKNGIYSLALEDRLLNEDYSAAIESIDKLLDIANGEVELIKNVDSSPEGLSLQESLVNHFTAIKYMITAEKAKRDGNYIEAKEYYKKAREEWDLAIERAIAYELPPYMDILRYWSTLILEPAVRNCKRENDLRDKIDENQKLISSLNNEFKEIKVIVDVDTNTEVKNTIEQNVQIVNNIELKVKDNLQTLVEELNNMNEDELAELGIDLDRKNQLETKANELINSKEHPSNFLDKAKKFTQDIADIVENLEKTAKPFVPLIGLAALFI